MPDMIRIENSLLHYKVKVSWEKQIEGSTYRFNLIEFTKKHHKIELGKLVKKIEPTQTNILYTDYSIIQFNW